MKLFSSIAIATLTTLIPSAALANQLAVDESMEDTCTVYADGVRELTYKRKQFSGDNFITSIFSVEAAKKNPKTPTTGNPIIASCTATALWANDGQTFIDFNVEEKDRDKVILMYYPHGH